MAQTQGVPQQGVLCCYSPGKTQRNFRRAGNYPETGVSEPVLKSVEPLFDKSDEPPATSVLPGPPRARRHLSLGSLLLISLLSLALAYLLLPEARFALNGASPVDLGDLNTADLNQQHSNWVEGTGLTDPHAVAFRRRGTRGSFRLARLKDRADLWVLLHAPEHSSVNSYVPPRHFSGRLLKLDEAGPKEAPLVGLVRDEATRRKSEATYLLLEGESPRSQRDSLLAAILFGLLGLGCLAFAGRLLSPG